MVRALLSIALLAVVSCSRSPAEATAAAPGAGAQTPAAATVAPVPAQLPEVVARVNGENVTRQEFEDSVKSLEARAGRPVPTDQRDQIYRRVLDQVVGYKLLQQEATSRNIVIADGDVDARIAEIKKQFPSEDVFMQMLIDRKLTLEKIRDDARRDMAVGRMLASEVEAKSAVTPEQVQDFYAKNPAQFLEPERARASHILISVQKGADEAAKANARARAESLLKELKAGKEFAAMAKEHSQDPGSAVNGGDLGVFRKGQMVGPFNDVAFSLEPGKLSDLVETEFGFHIIKVAERHPSRTVPLEEVRSRLEQFLLGRNRQEQTDAFVKTLRDKGKVEILI